MVRVAGDHRLDQAGAFRRLAGLGQHLGERELQVAGGVGGRGAVEQLAQRRDPGLGAALGEVEPGQRPLERAGVGGGGDAGLELGPGGLGAADLEQELRERQRRLRIVGGARGGGAQHRLGAVGVARAQVPLDQAAPHPGVVGKERGHVPELGPDAGHVAGRLEGGEAHEVQAPVLGRLRQRHVDEGQRLRRRAGVEAVGDQHHLGRDVVGGLGDHRPGHRHRRGAGRGVAEVDGGLERAHHRVGRRLGEGLGGVLLGGGEVLHLEGDLDDGALRLEVRRVLVGHPQVLPHRLAGGAALALHAGEGEPRRDMVAVEAEDVAELDQRPVGIAFGEQRDAALIVLLGAHLGAVAGGEPEQGGEHQHRPERPEGGAHRGSGSVSSARAFAARRSAVTYRERRP